MVSQTDAVDIVDSALDAGKTWFVDSVSTLLGDQEYSDLKITCQTLELKVHKAIMCTQSKFFRNACKKGAFKEGITGVIDLPDDEPLAVEAMIDFLYTAKWQPEKPAYLLEAQTYVLAEKYGIFALKHAVFSNIHAQLLDRTDMKGFDKAVKWVYSNTTQEDPIRDIFILFVVNDTQNLFDEKNGPISQLVLELPEFSLDILRAIRNGDQFFQTATFYTPINGPNVEEPTTFRCRGCGSDWKLDVNELLGGTPNCPACINPMDKIARECTLMHRWDCRTCTEVCLSDIPYSYNGAESWRCFYCGGRGFKAPELTRKYPLNSLNLF